ncbi:hypothetical protein DJ69_15625 [Halorubrum persicum]|uniref:Uncharacterized protein n=1 Tax=Halorubrum persicum TaxID=1383844 RepID=A0A2G1WF97_9EURY|nr:hypothetical protein [Halorubrum persicum]PHQ37652.1 hypothetical protein DJ69_15625 [Halorubrum persicum]
MGSYNDLQWRTDELAALPRPEYEWKWDAVVDPDAGVSWGLAHRLKDAGYIEPIEDRPGYWSTTRRFAEWVSDWFPDVELADHGQSRLPVPDGDRCSDQSHGRKSRGQSIRNPGFESVQLDLNGSDATAEFEAVRRREELAVVEEARRAGAEKGPPKSMRAEDDDRQLGLDAFAADGDAVAPGRLAAPDGDVIGSPSLA